MHELAVTQSVLEIALRHAEGAGASRITDLYLVIGELSSIVDDSVQFYWDIVTKDSIAQGSQLHFRRIVAEMQCEKCRHRFVLRGGSYLCPACGEQRVIVVTGDEFYLESIEVEEAKREKT